jgi:short subunit dehydrogenase-like uncharacterized protein
MQVLQGGGWIRRNGRLVRARLGSGARRQDTPVGERTLVPAPTADLVVSGHTTGIPDITVSIPTPLSPATARLVMPALPVLARLTTRLRRRPTEARPTTGTQTDTESHLWARATAADGRTAEAWTRTGEGYAYTARAAVLAVEAALGAEPLGATTVARAFGPDLTFAAGSELVGSA